VRVRNHVAGLVLLGALLQEGPLAAQTDPFYARVRGLVDAPYPSFQGADCVHVNAPTATVWRVLVGPEGVPFWLFAELENVVPRDARYRKGPTASTGDTLTVTANTTLGPRKIELTVLALQPGQVISIRVSDDPEGVLTAGASSLIATLVVEALGDGTSDVWWATHYESDSPLSAALSGLGGGRRRYRMRREGGLLAIASLSEAAARLPYPPLHDVPLPGVPPLSAYRPPVRRK
jgi:uncharacterized protein YndB with AHSA1/START domain